MYSDCTPDYLKMTALNIPAALGVRHLLCNKCDSQHNNEFIVTSGMFSCFVSCQDCNSIAGMVFCWKAAVVQWTASLAL